MSVRRIIITQDPLRDKDEYRFESAAWPARWVGPQTHEVDTSVALIFRLKFISPAHEKVRIHLSADQRYELFIDGEFAGRGVERSDLKHWIYESYELILAPGEHLITLRLWWVAATAPAAEAQLSHRPAILVFAEGQANERLSTGIAPWEYAERTGYSFADFDRDHLYFATGALLSIDGSRVDCELDAGRSGPWHKVRPVETSALVYNTRESRPWWILQPASLPPMHEKKVHVGIVRHIDTCVQQGSQPFPVDLSHGTATEQAEWQDLISGRGKITLLPNQSRRIILDLEDYYCAYPTMICSGEKASVNIRFAESLYEFDAAAGKRLKSKGHRDEVNGKCFFGIGFSFIAGTRPYPYQSHTFCAGRYIEISVIAAEVGLIIESFSLIETHFPYLFSAAFASSRKAHAKILPVAFRTLLMCSHDTSMDCPYYERLNYVGDTRLQSLVAYVSADEEALARKGIELFDYSRSPSGLTASRYPSRTLQTIPPFSLYWAAMVHDFACWRDDMEFVRARMPGVRAIIEHWLGRREKNGLLSCPDGWNFVDWVPSWKSGIPLGGTPASGSFSSILNLHMVYTLRLAAELEEEMGEPLLAKRYREQATKLGRKVLELFFDKRSGLIADDLSKTQFSEHAQCLAVLSGTVKSKAAHLLINRMLTHTPRAEATLYFQHYLFEALGAVGRTDVILDKLSLWETLSANGFRTTFESPEPVRSDCHAWGAHPVYHFLATLAGIRPEGFGCKRVIIRPQPASLTFLKGKMPLKKQHLCFDLEFEKGIDGTITLPAGLSGELRYLGKKVPLLPGKNKVRIRYFKSTNDRTRERLP